MATGTFGFTIDKAKGLFFDSELVLKQVAADERKAFSMFGSFVRRRGQTSMRKASDKTPASAPGSPPRSRKGLLRKYLFFVWNPESKSVIIGPALLAGHHSADPQAPELQEHGGDKVWDFGHKGKVVAHYPARPFMQPAFDAELKNLPSIWDKVRS